MRNLLLRNMDILFLRAEPDRYPRKNRKATARSLIQRKSIFWAVQRTKNAQGREMLERAAPMINIGLLMFLQFLECF
jgi:hypothetical protein